MEPRNVKTTESETPDVVSYSFLNQSWTIAEGRDLRLRGIGWSLRLEGGGGFGGGEGFAFVEGDGVGVPAGHEEGRVVRGLGNKPKQIATDDEFELRLAGGVRGGTEDLTDAGFDAVDVDGFAPAERGGPGLGRGVPGAGAG